MINNYKLVLASSSERRLTMLSKIGYKPDIIDPPNIDESTKNKEKPRAYVKRLAKLKAEIVFKRHRDSFIIAADTAIVSGSKIFGKAETSLEAYKVLSTLSGKRHKVYGGVCVISPSHNVSIRTIITQVSFRLLNKQEILDYIDSNEWKDKAGCYAIQGRASKFIRRINGNYDNIVGISLLDAEQMLQGLK